MYISRTIRTSGYAESDVSDPLAWSSHETSTLNLFVHESIMSSESSSRILLGEFFQILDDLGLDYLSLGADLGSIEGGLLGADDSASSNNVSRASGDSALVVSGNASVSFIVGGPVMTGSLDADLSDGPVEVLGVSDDKASVDLGWDNSIACNDWQDVLASLRRWIAF